MDRLKTAWLVLIVVCLIGAVRSTIVDGQGRGNRVTVYEGALLITGDGTAPIENAAFLVENDTFTRVGLKGQIQVPAGAARVDLTGKFVMPTKVDMHGHIGYQHDWDGTMAKEYFTRENLIDHLERVLLDDPIKAFYARQSRRARHALHFEITLAARFVINAICSD